MGKRKTRITIIQKHIAQLERLEENCDLRIDIFKKELEEALNCNNKNVKLLKLDRIYDEINGYCSRVDHSDSAIKSIYENNLPRVKDIRQLEVALDNQYYDNENYKTSKRFKTNRNKGCHPDPYYLNTDMIEQAEDTKMVLNNAIKKSKCIINVNNVDEFSIKKEKNRQEKFLEMKSKETINNARKNDELIRLC